MKYSIVLLSLLPLTLFSQVDVEGPGTTAGSGTETLWIADSGNVVHWPDTLTKIASISALTVGLATKAPQTAVDTLPGDNELTNKLALKADQTEVDTLVGDNELANGLAAAVVDASENIVDSLANMKAGIFNVLDYGADPTGVADATSAIQAAINAAKHGTVIIPSGTYLVDSLYTNYATQIKGTGWANVYGTGGTTLKSTTASPILCINHGIGTAWSEGASVSDLEIKGNVIADDGVHRQTGLWINTEAPVFINHVWIDSCGDYGIRMGSVTHVSVITVENSRIRLNVKGGIYGRSITNQLNAIRILNNEIDVNGFGINLTGTNVIIEKNTIQGNDSSGVFMYAGDQSENSYSRNTLIDGNYFENNGGGDIYIAGRYADPLAFYHYAVEISNNYFYTSLAQIDKANVVSSITFARFGGTATPSIQDAHVRDNNHFAAPSTTKWVDGGSMLHRGCSIELPYSSTPRSYILNPGDAWVQYNGTGVRVLKYTIGTPGDTGMDFVFSTAANVTAQNIDLGAVLPVSARVIGIEIIPTEALVSSGGAVTMAMKAGSSSGGDEYIAAVNVQDLGFPGGIIDATKPAAVTMDSDDAHHIYIQGVPSRNWDTLTAGKYEVNIACLQY